MPLVRADHINDYLTVTTELINAINDVNDYLNDNSNSLRGAFTLPAAFYMFYLKLFRLNIGVRETDPNLNRLQKERLAVSGAIQAFMADILTKYLDLTNDDDDDANAAP